MSKFSRRSTVLVAVAAAVGLTALVATATGGTSKKQAGSDVCFLLPDTKTSIRWEQFDRPAMAKSDAKPFAELRKWAQTFYED